MDLDGDGVISMYEMEYFYEEQVQKMEAMGIEKLPFEDCLCQVRNTYTRAHMHTHTHTHAHMCAHTHTQT
jgi:hypothetical protein